MAALSAAAVLLVGNTGFTLRCNVDQHQMDKLVNFAVQRQNACQRLGLLWEADDQERQYKPGTSAGTNETIGPIAGFVMDVTENEFGHAQGQCHSVKPSYKELVAQY